MDKLRNTEISIASIRDVNALADNNISHVHFKISDRVSIENLSEKENESEDKTVTTTTTTIATTKTQNKPAQPRKKKIPFSQMEDKFIADGLRKHGPSRWTAILNNCSSKFHLSRKASTLDVRSKSKHLV